MQVLVILCALAVLWWLFFSGSKTPEPGHLPPPSDGDHHGSDSTAWDDLSPEEIVEHYGRLQPREQSLERTRKYLDARSELKAREDAQAKAEFNEKQRRYLQRRAQEKRAMDARRKQEQEEETVRRELLRKKISSLAMSADRHDYVIQNGDYKRGLKKERRYLKEHKATLFRLFDNRCVKCGADDQGLSVDHFVFSKNEGGCFMMRHKEGYWVNNGIPLCNKCNSAKLDRSYESFFSQEELVTILEKSKLMSHRLNQHQA